VTPCRWLVVLDPRRRVVAVGLMAGDLVERCRVGKGGNAENLCRINVL
jgi:hypothetical protein